MSLVQFLVQGTQPDYRPQVETIARSWEAMLGPCALEPLDDTSFVDRVIDKVESGTVSESFQIQILSDLLSLSWWRGFSISDENAGRLFRCASYHFAALCDLIDFPTRAVSVEQAKQNHSVFVGALQDPLHSPSSAAIDYVVALALHPQSKVINVYFSGALSKGMIDFINTKLSPFYGKKKINIYKNVFDDKLIIKIYKGLPGTIHYMCEPHFSPLISVLNFVGPSVMFVCNDEIPIQYSDLYWYIHKENYIKKLWAKRHAPQNIINNYCQIDSYPSPVTLRPTPKDRAKYAIAESNFVIATVGNRLGSDLDEGFVTGIELTLKAHPNAIWMVVGELPKNLLFACNQVFGDRFRHVPFEPELDQLMAMVDVFANPFRPGGGTSAYIALGAGCVVLSLNSGGVASLIPEDHLAVSVDDYFDKLAHLISDRGEYEAWQTVQSKRAIAVADPKAFSNSLYEAIEIAQSRYQCRQGKSLNEMIFGCQSFDPRGQAVAA